MQFVNLGWQNQMGVVRGGGLPPPPAGFAYWIDDDGAYFVDDDGAFVLLEV